MDFILYALIISVLVSVTVALLIMKRSNRGVNNEENIFLKEYIKKLENENKELFISLKSAFENIQTKSFFINESSNE